MPVFRFRLQKVLDYRLQREEQARMDLTRARHLYRIQAEKVEGLAARLAGHDMARQGQQPRDASEFWLWRTYREWLNFELNKERHKLQELATVVAGKRQVVIESAKERNLLEKLKSRRFMEHQRTEQLVEQRQHDEIATIRFQAKSF